MIDQVKLKENSEDYPLHSAVPQELPHPTFWPLMMAFGALFFFWGLVASWIVSLIGILLMGFSIAGWIGELSDE